MPFPSTVTSGCPNTDVQAVAREIVDTARDKNNLLNSAGNVHLLIRDHYVDTKNGIYGIESLIASILKSHGSQFPKGIELGEFRKVAIAASMFASEVISEVQNAFGKDRYPYATIHSYLSYFMTRNGKLGKIKLSNAEDSTRPSDICKPRTKFYMIEAAR